MRSIAAAKLFAIIRGIAPERTVPVAQALWRGGVRLLEVAIDHTAPAGVDDVVHAVSLVRQADLPELSVGAGTVLTVEQVGRVAEAGARFVVAPNVDPAVIAETVRRGMVALPGAMTATEIITARNAGAQAIKLFPAGVLGPGYLRALLDPLKGVPLIAVGGVNESNAADFIAAGALAVGVGGSLVKPADVAAGDFAAIEHRAAAMVAALESAG